MRPAFRRRYSLPNHYEIGLSPFVRLVKLILFGHPFTSIYPILNTLSNDLHHQFCIGYEMPPWLIHLLDTHRIPYIDLRLHPIRFLDDLLFAVRASVLETQAALLSVAIYEFEVFATAGLREAMCRYISDAQIPDNTLLVAGQRRFDSTQIVDGGFFDATARTADIHAICARYEAIALKPHPLDRSHTLLQVAAAASTHVVGVIDDNVYQMLSLPQISAV